MKASSITHYLAIPIAFTLAVEIYVIYSRGIDTADAGRVLYGSLFYSLPFLVWLLITKLGSLSKPIAHSGFIACSLSMGLISLAWFLPPDPSGLPMQWVLYWPLSAFLVLIASVSTAFWKRATA